MHRERDDIRDRSGPFTEDEPLVQHVAQERRRP